MPTTLQEAMALMKEIKKPAKNLTAVRQVKKKNIADELLRKYKGIIPSRKTSTEIIKEFRSSLYGKVKK